MVNSQIKRTDLLLPRVRQSGGGKDRESGISRCKPLYTEWINNKALLYSTGNSIQYPVINHNGNEFLGEKKRERWQ